MHEAYKGVETAHVKLYTVAGNLATPEASDITPLIASKAAVVGRAALGPDVSTADQEQTLLDAEPGIVMKRIMSFYMGIDLPLPPGESLAELRNVARTYAWSAAELEGRQKSLIIRLYRLEDDTCPDKDALAIEYGVTKQTIVPLERRIMGRLADIRQLREIIPHSGTTIDYIPDDGVSVFSVADILGCSAAALAADLRKYDLLSGVRTDRLPDNTLLTWTPTPAIKPFIAGVLEDQQPRHDPASPDRTIILRERALCLLTQKQADAQKLMTAYPRLNQKAATTLLGWPDQGLTKAVRTGRAELARRLPDIETGTFDWAAWGDQALPYVPRQNPLVLAAKLGIVISPMATMDEASATCRHVFEQSHITTPDERKLVAALYKLDNTMPQDGKELAAISGISVDSTLVNIRRTVGHLRDTAHPRHGHPITVKLPAGNTIELPALADNSPEIGLEIIRMSLRCQAIRTDSTMTEAKTYAAYLSTVLRREADAEQPAGEPEAGFDSIVYAMTKVLLRQGIASGSSLEGHTARDLAILRQYLSDAAELTAMGHVRAAATAKYNSPATVRALLAANTDIPSQRLITIIDINPVRSAEAITAYKDRVAAMISRFQGHAVITPGIIRSFAVDTSNNLAQALETYAKIVDQVTQLYALNPLVTRKVISTYCRCNPTDPASSIDAWLTRRSDLIARHKTGRDISPTFLSTIAQLAPSSPDLTHEQHTQELDGHVNVYKQGLQRLRSTYAGHADFTDATLRQCARSYPLDPEGAAQRYLECLSMLRETFQDDAVVEDLVLQYAAYRYMSNNQLGARNLVTNWIANFERLKSRYQDNQELDDDTLKVIALYWPDRPGYGLKRIMRSRYKRTDSLNREVNDSGRTVYDILPLYVQEHMP